MKARRLTFALLIGLAIGGWPIDRVSAQQPEAGAPPAPLTLTRRIPLPGVIGRLDHMGMDSKRGRLIQAALGNDSVEIVDLNGMKVVHSIPGQSRPQGVLHMPDSDRLLVANEGGKTNIYRGDNFELVKALDVPDGDNVRYDLEAKLVYVASEREITVVDASTLQIAGTIKLQEGPNSFQLEAKGTRLPQVDLPALKAAMEHGPVEVSVRAHGDEGAPIKGPVEFFDSAVDSSTGTIAVRAKFGNEELRLWPGQFVNVAVALSTELDVLTVPQTAVQVGQNGTYVFVIKSDRTAEVRPVKANRTVDGRSVIASGLNEGEEVAVDGHLRLGNGTRVEVKKL